MLCIYIFSVVQKINVKRKMNGEEVLVIVVVIIMKIQVHHMAHQVPTVDPEMLDTMTWRQSKFSFFFLLYKNIFSPYCYKSQQ